MSARSDAVQRLTGYTVVVFGAFVVVWFLLFTLTRSQVSPDGSSWVTDVEIHSLDIRWGWDLLAVPLSAALAAAVLRWKRHFGSLLAASGLGLLLALGMMVFPAAVMGGRFPWPFTTTYLDANGYLDLAITYAVVTAAALLIINRLAAHQANSGGTLSSGEIANRRSTRPTT